MRFFVVVLVYSLVVIALHLLSYFNPRAEDWGFHHYPYLPTAWLIGGGIAAILVFLLAWTIRPGERSLRIPAIWGATVAAAAAGVLFWAGRGLGHFLGDGPSRIESLVQGRFLWHVEPGGILVPYYLFRLTGSEDPVLIFAALSVGCGVLYVFLSALFSREVAGDSWGRGLVFGLLVLAGLTRVFYGFVETAPLLVVTSMLYLVVTFYYLRGKGRAWTVALTGALVILVHATGLLLLPSMVFALWRGGKHEEGSLGRRLAWLAIPLAGILGEHLYLKTVGAGMGDVVDYFLANILPLTGEGGVRVQYPILSVEHVFDFLKQEILIGPFAAFFTIILLVLGAQWRLGREGYFLLLAGFPWWVFSFVFNHEIGAPRQWALFIPASLPFLLLIGIALVRIPWRRDRPRLAGAIAGVLLATSIFHTLPWVGVGMDRDRALAHFVGLYAPGSPASPYARSYAFDQIGTFYLSQGQLDNGLMAFMEAVTADTTNGYAAGHLGSVLLSTGQVRRSAEFLKWATRKSPTLEYLHFELGNAFSELGAPDSAAQSFRNAIAINPEFRQAYVNLAVAERQLGKLAEAEQVLREGMTIYPKDALMVANLGRLEQDRGDTVQAVALYRQALELDPDDSNIAYNLANLLMTQRRFQEAIPYFEVVVNRTPGDAEAWINLGAARNFVGDSGGAMQAFQQGLLADPSKPEPYFNIVNGLLAIGDTTRAITVLESYAFRDSTTHFGVLARRLLEELGASP